MGQVELHLLVQGQERRGLKFGALKKRAAGPIGRALWSDHCRATVLSGANVTGAEKENELIYMSAYKWKNPWGKKIQ